MNVETMTRSQIITELAAYTSPQEYHGLLTWDTPRLKALLVLKLEEKHAGATR